MSTRTPAVLAVFASMVASGSAFGQGSVVEPGAHVRIGIERTWSKDSFVGIVQRASADSIVLLPDGARQPSRFALSSITELQVSRGRGSRGKGLLIGGTLGGVAGALAGVLMRQDCPPANDLGSAIVVAYCSATNQTAPFLLGGLGLLVGGGIGALVGGGERWRTIPMAPVAVASSPRGGVDIALRVGDSFSVR